MKTPFDAKWIVVTQETLHLLDQVRAGKRVWVQATCLSTAGFFEALATQARRTRALNLSAELTSQYISQIQELRMSRLRILRLRNSLLNPNPLSTRLSLTVFPRLLHLELYEVFPTWTSIANLLSLSIHTSTNGPRLSELRVILTQCPDLKALALSYEPGEELIANDTISSNADKDDSTDEAENTGDTDNARQPPTPPLIPLLQLQILRLELPLPAEKTSILLSSIISDNLAVLDLARAGQMNAVDLITRPRTAVTALLDGPMSSASTTVDVEYQIEQVVVKMGGNEARGLVQPQAMWWEEADIMDHPIRAIFTIPDSVPIVMRIISMLGIPADRIQALAFTSTIHHAEALDEFIPVHASIWSPTILRIPRHDEAARLLLQWLKESVQDEHGRSKMRMARLTTLCVAADGVDVAREVMEVVVARTNELYLDQYFTDEGLEPIRCIRCTTDLRNILLDGTFDISLRYGDVHPLQQVELLNLW